MLLEHIWQYIIAGVGAVLWFGRLEAKTNAAHARIDAMEKQRHEDLQASLLSRSEVINSISDLRKEIVVVQGDIKTLLRAVPK